MVFIESILKSSDLEHQSTIQLEWVKRFKFSSMMIVVYSTVLLVSAVQSMADARITAKHLQGSSCGLTEL
jgi:hypothetical protein